MNLLLSFSCHRQLFTAYIAGRTAGLAVEWQPVVKI